MSEVSGIPPSVYSLSNAVRDLSDEFTAVLQTSGGLLALIKETDRATLGESGKLEWLEDVESYETDTLDNGGAVAAADTTFVVAHVARFAVNMIIKFADYDETMFVTAVNSGTSTLTVTRSQNGLSAPTTVADLSTIDIISRPVAEYSRTHNIGILEPTTQYNYFEQMREDIPFSAQIAKTRQYGFPTPEAYINYNIERKMRVLKSRLNREIIWGERNEGSDGVPSRLRGVYTWLRQAGTNATDGSAAALTATVLNNTLEAVYNDDTREASKVLYMDTIQARVMASFNTAVANRMQTVGFDEKIAAGNRSVTMYAGDLEATGMPKIIVDRDAPKGTVMLLNLDKIKLVYGPSGRLQQWDSKPNDMLPNAKQIGLALQASLEMKDHTTSHGIIYNLKKTL